MTRAEWDKAWKETIARDVAIALVGIFLHRNHQEGCRRGPPRGDIVCTPQCGKIPQDPQGLYELVQERPDDLRWFGFQARPRVSKAWCLCGQDLSREMLEHDIKAITGHLVVCPGVPRSPGGQDG